MYCYNVLNKPQHFFVFQIYCTPCVTFILPRVSIKFDPKCMVPTVNIILVWGCMRDFGVGEMFICEGRMDSKIHKYPWIGVVALIFSFSTIRTEVTLKTNQKCIIYQHARQYGSDKTPSSFLNVLPSLQTRIPYNIYVNY